jgi:hypothetical protein
MKTSRFIVSGMIFSSSGQQAVAGVSRDHPVWRSPRLAITPFGDHIFAKCEALQLLCCRVMTMVVWLVVWPVVNCLNIGRNRTEKDGFLARSDGLCVSMKGGHQPRSYKRISVR